jgi:tetratricopeptide (TPR) repeat protein
MAGWTTVNLFLFQLFLYSTVAPHELGHAVVARALGYRVFSIICGVGPTLVDRIVGNVRVRVRGLPISGVTLAAPCARRAFRVRAMLMLGAGVGVNAAMLAFVLWLAPDLSFRRLTTGPAPGLVFVAASALVIALNLFPMKMLNVNGPLPNDGLQLLRVPWLKPEEIDDALAVRYMLEANQLNDRGGGAEALAWIEQGLRAHPRVASLQLAMGYTLALIGDCEGTRRYSMEVAALPDVKPFVQAIAWNNTVWANVVTAANDRLEESDRLSQQALKVLGWMPAIKGTRGAVLVEMQRTEEGIQLLREALREGVGEDLHPMARATYCGSLALGLVAQGRPEEARESFEAARVHFPSCPLLPRVEAVLGQAIL